MLLKRGSAVWIAMWEWQEVWNGQNTSCLCALSTGNTTFRTVQSPSITAYQQARCFRCSTGRQHFAVDSTRVGLKHLHKCVGTASDALLLTIASSAVDAAEALVLVHRLCAYLKKCWMPPMLHCNWPWLCTQWILCSVVYFGLLYVYAAEAFIAVWMLLIMALLATTVLSTVKMALSSLVLPQCNAHAMSQGSDEAESVEHKQFCHG